MIGGCARGFAGGSGGGTPTSPTAIPTWFPCFEFDFTDFNGFGALEGDIEIHSLPLRATIEGVVIKTTTAFVGTGITELTFTAGIVGDLAKLLSPYDGLAAVSDTNFSVVNTMNIENFGAATSIRLAAKAVGANLDQLTAGAGCLWIKGALIPAP